MKHMDRFQSQLIKEYVFHPLLVLLKRRAIPSLDLLLTASLPSDLLQDLLIILPEMAET